MEQQCPGWTIREAAREIGVSEKTIRRMVKAGQLDAERVGTPTGYVYRVSCEAVDAERIRRGAMSTKLSRPEENADAMQIERFGRVETGIESLSIKMDGVQADVQKLTEHVSKLAEENAELRRQIEIERGRTLWQRLTGR